MTPPETFRAALQHQFDHSYPGHDGGKVTVRVKGGTIRIKLVPSAARVVDAPGQLTAMQEAILEALSKHTGAPITGDDLASAAGYEATGGAWRKALAELIAQGHIENCRPGYRLRSEANG